MKITVKLFATFRMGRFQEEQRDYPEGAIVRQVVADLGIEGGTLGIVLVNGRHAYLDQALSPEDTLSLFPLIGGG